MKPATAPDPNATAVRQATTTDESASNEAPPIAEAAQLTAPALGAINDTAGVGELRCPEGHDGPWRYIEQIEVFREVKEVSSDTRHLTIDSWFETEEGYWDGVPETEYLECRFSLPQGGRCIEAVQVPTGWHLSFD